MHINLPREYYSFNVIRFSRNMDIIMDKIVQNYKENVDKALADQNATEEQIQVLREKFMTAFKTNLEIGLRSVFGNVGNINKKTSAPATEVTVEDMMKRGNSTYIVTFDTRT